MSGPASPVVIGGTVLARVGGVSAAALDAICLPRTAAALARADAVASRLDAQAEPLEAALFRLVPTLEGDARRAALALKRDVHNARTPRAPVGAELEAALGELPPWLAAVRERDAALAESAAALRTELERAERAVVSGLRDATVADGIALASPAFALQLEQLPDGHGAPARTRIGRSCVAYLSRTALKTSPFSTLTTVAATGFVDAPLPPTTAPRRRLLPARALALELLYACAQHPRLASAFRYAPAEWVWRDGARTGVLVPRHLCTNGFFHRQERVADAGGYEPSLRLLRRVGVAGYTDYLAALAGQEPHAAFRRLVATRLLHPIAPWERDDDDRLTALSDALRPVDAEASERVAALARAIRAVAQPGAARRARALSEVRRASMDTLSALGARPPRWLNGAALVHEDVVGAHPVAPLPAAVRDDLEQLAAHLRPRMVRTRFYDRLVAHFRARYGAGAMCTDLVDYLSSFMARPDLPHMVRESMAEDAAAIACPGSAQSRAEVGPSSAVPAASLFFSLVAEGPDALAAGRYALVPSHLNPGLGGLLARSGPALGAQTAGALRDWVHTVHPQALAVELAAAGDWSALHAGSGALPALRWPADTPTADRELTLGDLRLSHDADRDTLTLHDRHGRPVAPVYLGVAPPHMIRGPLRLLLTLGDPWVAGHRFGWERGPWDPAPQAPRGIEHDPRHTEGRLVLRRARWRVDPESFPRQGLGEEDGDFLRRAGRWRRAHGIPEEVFVTIERREFTLAATRRKPTWVSWDSLHALAAAGHRIADDAVAVNLVEALPGRCQHPARDADGLPRAAEYVALLAWPATAHARVPDLAATIGAAA